MKHSLGLATLALACALPRLASASQISPAVDATFEFSPSGYYDGTDTWQIYTTPSYFTLAGINDGSGVYDVSSIAAWQINSPDGNYSQADWPFTSASGSGSWTYAPDNGPASLSSLDVTFDGPVSFLPPFIASQSDEITLTSGTSGQMDFEWNWDISGLGPIDPVLLGHLSYLPNGIPVPDGAATALLLAASLGALALARRRSYA